MSDAIVYFPKYVNDDILSMGFTHTARCPGLSGTGAWPEVARKAPYWVNNRHDHGLL